MESSVYHRDTCRLCEGPELELVLKMTPSPPVDAYVTAQQLKEKQEPFPMDLYLCQGCGHAQLLDVVSPKLLFGSYIYTTSSSPGLVDYFREYASAIHEQLKPHQGAFALDIGSNDGTLLSFFKERGLRVLGVDPAREIANAATASGIETLPEFFNSEVALRIRRERGPVDIITANNVFAHSDQLGDMAEGIRILLAPDGTFVFEVSYLLDLVQNMIFDFIYHEHLSHHSVKPLLNFLRRHGLQLFAVERTPSKGGSLRCFAQLIGGPRTESSSLAELIKLEDNFGLHRSETYKIFSARIEAAKQRFHDLLKRLQSEGKKIAGYGASATSTVLTYQFEIGESMGFIIDDNPLRQNRFSPGYHIPVVSSRALVEQRPDYVVVLVWRFADMIIKRNQGYLDKGGHFIVPLPELRLV